MLQQQLSLGVTCQRRATAFAGTSGSESSSSSTIRKTNITAEVLSGLRCKPLPEPPT